MLRAFSGLIRINSNKHRCSIYNKFQNCIHFTPKNHIIPYKFIISINFSYSQYMESKPRLSNKEETLSFLKENNINYHLENHEKAETVQAGLDLIKTTQFQPEQYTFCKNLFIKNKAGGLILLTANPVKIFNNIIYRLVILVSKYSKKYSRPNQEISGKQKKIS
jgi:hypothetical protein